MNKYPWFTHDNDAHEDDKHQLLIHKFGVEGYGAKWILTELFDRHGVGDNWETNIPFLMHKLRMRRKKLLELLQLLREEVGLKSDIFQEKVIISIPKMRKRQANRKSKGHPKHSNKKNKNNTKTPPTEESLDGSENPTHPKQGDLDFESDDPKVRSAVAVLRRCSRVSLEKISIILPVWIKSYPDVDVSFEISKAEAWAHSTGTTRGAKGWKRTLNTWLSKEQDSVRKGGYNGRSHFQKEAGHSRPQGNRFPKTKF